MKKKIEMKVPGGKLLRMEVDFEETVRSVKITGDFFLHPETDIQALENALIGVGRREDESMIRNRIETLVRGRGIEMIGFSPEDVSQLLKRILESPV